MEDTGDYVDITWNFTYFLYIGYKSHMSHLYV